MVRPSGLPTPLATGTSSLRLKAQHRVLIPLRGCKASGGVALKRNEFPLRGCKASGGVALKRNEFPLRGCEAGTRWSAFFLRVQ